MTAMAQNESLLPTTGGNAPELRVSELAAALKRTIEDRFGLVRVRGEISNYRGPHASGHAYFCLKDEGARLDAVVWKGTFARLKTKLEEGLEVVATGRLTTFPGKSAYQIVVEAIEPAGVGALMALLDERRKRLAAEGLFDLDRKRPLPYLPAVVGVVTSPTGAVIRDILHRLAERFPRRVLVWPVRVQGDSCAREVAAAIEGFNALHPGGPIPRPDVLIVARGGGSLEDLWGFNEEIVVRAAAASAIPLIAAIGHETDTTLIDFAADLRAPTPTAAAEKAAPVRRELMEATVALGGRLRGAEGRRLQQAALRLSVAARLLGSPDEALATPRQRRDLAQERFRAAIRTGAGARRLRLAKAAQALARHSPQAELARTKERLSGFSARLKQGLRARAALARHENLSARRRLETATARLQRAQASLIPGLRAKLEQLEQLRRSLGPGAALQRGFALVRDTTGGLIRAAGAVSPGQKLELEFADGKVLAQAEGGADAKPRRGRSQRAADETQGSLF
ncbi:MAG TPA: exodeoxyribonuclease VII large subunit [Methylocystis sp.]|nr:exodeoxyribonuclease VII large subunit [Methylocystis sp.]